MNFGIRKSLRSTCAWTLMEMAVTVGVLGVLTAIITPFYFEQFKASYISEQRNNINNDMREFMREISDNGKDANVFLVYDSFANADRAADTDRLGDGQAGEFLLFVYQEDPDATNLGARDTVRIRGYFREPDATTEIGPLRVFEVDFDPATNAPIETLIPDETEASTFEAIIDEMEGKVGGETFYNFRNRSVMINARILHGNQAKQVTETFNFTVSPRG